MELINFSGQKRGFGRRDSADCKQRNDLLKNKTILSLKPDKGNTDVLLNKIDYQQKMMTIINDTTKFKILNEDLLTILMKQEDKINRLLSKMKENKEISPEEYKELYVTGSQPGILYGLPKIHKPNVPLRPILSSIGTAGYALSKFFVPLLKPLTFNQYSVKDSFSFVEEITNIPNSNSYTMVSFDVQSLFTNIPLVETINIAADKYFSQESYRFFSLKSFNSCC